MAGWFDVAREAELLPGQAKLVDVDGVMVAVVNLANQYYAIEDVCSHDSAPMLGSQLELEQVIDGTEIICPRHGARFCIKTGSALSPPAYEAVTTFPVRVENGVIQVKDDRWE